MILSNLSIVLLTSLEIVNLKHQLMENLHIVPTIKALLLLRGKTQMDSKNVANI